MERSAATPLTAAALSRWTNLGSTTDGATHSASAIALSPSIRFTDAPVRIKGALQGSSGATS
jgi:hypothetical protein